MPRTPFASLDHEAVLNAVEAALECRLENICRPHSSYINRVYELQDEHGTFLVAKFFRPGRWTIPALLEELAFVNQCAAQEIPVVAPMMLADGTWLGSYEAIPFVVYPRCGGRLVDEYGSEQWLEIGRLLGRVHQVGAAASSSHRNRLEPVVTTREQADYILAHEVLPETLKTEFSALVEDLITEIQPLFEGIEQIRIHGDCHRANLIYRPGESFYLIDFDDMVSGPPVQDLWMLLPDVPSKCRGELALLLEGYETFRPFDDRSLRLIEPLRAMRFVHYLCWCGRQFVEDGETRIDDSYGTYAYWRRELDELDDQLRLIRAGVEP